MCVNIHAVSPSDTYHATECSKSSNIESARTDAHRTQNSSLRLTERPKHDVGPRHAHGPDHHATRQHRPQRTTGARTAAAVP